MRILILTIFFASAFYYFSSNKQSLISDVAQRDAVKIKASAPKRAIIPVDVSVKAELPKIQKNSEEKQKIRKIAESEEVREEVPELSWTDLDQGWTTELKDLLSRLEPFDSEAIHQSYIGEVEGYKAEMEALINERQFKATELEISEVDQLITQLDTNHEDNLRNIFGAHYDAIKDHYNYYMEVNQSLEE